MHIYNNGKLRFLLLIYFLLIYTCIFSQNKSIDSLEQVLSKTKIDSSRVNILNDISWEYRFLDKNKAEDYAFKAINLGSNIKFYKGLNDAYFNLGSYNDSNFDLSISYFDKSLTNAILMKSAIRQVNSLKEIALQFSSKGNNTEGIKYLERALEIGKKNNLTKKVSEIYWFIGSFNNLNGEYARAIEYMTKGILVAESINDYLMMANIYNALGVVNFNLKNNSACIELYKKSVKYYELAKNEHKTGSVYNNLAVVHISIGELDQAMVFAQKGLMLLTNQNNKRDKTYSLQHIGRIHSLKKNYDQALDYYFQALKIREDLGNSRAMIISYNDIGKTYRLMGKLDEAIEYIDKSIALGKNTDLNKEIMDSYHIATDIKRDQKEFEKALEYFVEYLKVKDKLFSIEKNKQIAELTSKFDSQSKQKEIELLKKEKDLQHALFLQQQLLSENRKNEITVLNESKRFQELKLSQKEMEVSQQHAISRAKKKQLDLVRKENELKDENLKRKNAVIYFFILGSLLVIALSIVVYRSYRLKAKAFGILSKQKAIIEDKNKEILDSITYAKRIQSAILPHPKFVKEYFKDSFILYKPKDIVAGDFYWFEVIDDAIFFAAADCTGHGVPGAMVSVVCHNALNRSVKEYGLKKPGEILDKTREIVIAEFEKSDEDVKDGMDISLASLHFRAEKKNEKEELPSLSHSFSTLSWSGAHNPLWILRDNKIIEYKADKQPIGKFSEEKPFTTHEITIQKEDELYIFTDGFQDQFGGTKGKKFKVAQLREILLTTKELSMEEKCQKINEAFENWKGTLDQVDDVCIIGVRI